MDPQIRGGPGALRIAARAAVLATDGPREPPLARDLKTPSVRLGARSSRHGDAAAARAARRRVKAGGVGPTPRHGATSGRREDGATGPVAPRPLKAIAGGAAGLEVRTAARPRAGPRQQVERPPRGARAPTCAQHGAGSVAQTPRGSSPRMGKVATAFRRLAAHVVPLVVSRPAALRIAAASPHLAAFAAARPPKVAAAPL